MSRVRRIGLTLFSLAIGGSLVVVQSCATTSPVTHMAFTDTLSLTWPECPHDWSVIQFQDREKPQGVAITMTFPSGLSVPGPTTNIPEFHDCQRVIVDDTTYGPLMAVFAARDLAERTFSEREVPSLTYAAAEIVNHSSDFAYAPLGIGPMFNCLYIFRRPGTALRAKMVHVGSTEKDCAAPVNPDAIPGKELRVRETLKDKYDSSAIPPVARWDWDDTHKEQYIGLRCGNAWCEVGRPREGGKPDFVSSPPDLDPGTGPIDGPSRVRAIKGWYDEQHLAVENGLTVRPGRVVASVFPDPDLKSRDSADYHHRWQTVSHVAFKGHSSLYKTKFNFDNVPPAVPLHRMNRISMCFGRAFDCNVPVLSLEPGLINSCSKQKLFESLAVPRWWARIESMVGAPSDRTIYKCVVRRVHKGFNIPATVRWRWLADDETEWHYCPDGCCEMQAKFY